MQHHVQPAHCAPSPCHRWSPSAHPDSRATTRLNLPGFWRIPVGPHGAEFAKFTRAVKKSQSGRLSAQASAARIVGLAMYFQIRSARASARRLLLAGLPSARLPAARVGTGLLMAGLVSSAALIALAARVGIDPP